MKYGRGSVDNFKHLTTISVAKSRTFLSPLDLVNFWIDILEAFKVGR